MKLPTREALFTEFQELHQASGVERVGLEILLNKYVRLAEEEARREALEEAVQASVAAFREHIAKAPLEVVGAHNAGWAAIRQLLAAPATAEAECAHRWVDPTNEVVQSKGYEVCVLCGTLKPPGATAEAGKDQRIRDASKESHTTTFAQVHADAAPPAPPPSKAVTEERVREIVSDHFQSLKLSTSYAGTPENVESVFEFLLRARVELRQLNEAVRALDSARSAAGGKTDIEQAEVRGAVAMAKSIARTLREHGQRDAAKKIEEVLAPAAREGSGA